MTNADRTTDPRPRLPPNWFIRIAWAVHRGMYRWTGGRRGLWRATPEKWGTLRLHTIGRKSGKERIAILGYHEDGPNIVTVAMNGWMEGDPAWWVNLQANPDATLDLKGQTLQVRARAAAGEERERLWALFPGNMPFVDNRATETAIVVLEPRSDAR
jgi:deazaflavin-dependent oxidoreductase (nitroreductase family)